MGRAMANEREMREKVRKDFIVDGDEAVGG